MCNPALELPFPLSLAKKIDVAASQTCAPEGC